MRVAALDLGSNTTLLLIAEMSGKKMERILLDETTITKLGQGVHANRKFHPDALIRMRECLTRYSKEIKKSGCEKVVAVATSAARDVSNGHELIEMGRELGIPIHIIEGKREAQLTFWGAVSDRASGDGCAVIDVGGGSTEIIFDTLRGPIGPSIDVGSVRLTEMFIKEQPIKREAIESIRQHLKKEFSKIDASDFHVTEVIAVAGTPTTLAALDLKRAFDEKLVNGYKLTTRRIYEWVDQLAPMTVEQREKLPGMQPKRADVIVTGSLILAAAIEAVGKSEITVSTRGVRYGVALAWQEF